MTTKRNFQFQCVDDDSNADSLCLTLAEGAELATLKIPRRNPSSWEDEIAAILKQVKNGSIDGVLLDYRLDEKAAVNSKTVLGKPPVPVGYTADALVQELRRRSVGERELSFPIVLWSNADRLDEFRAIDPKFRQHYDWVIDKGKIPDPATPISDTLISFAKGYSEIRRTQKRTEKMSVFLNAPDTSLLASIDDFFEKVFRNGAFAYQTALFIIHEILESDGPLIRQATLQALLGVEVEALRSGKAKAFLAPFSYGGIFCEGFPRFWRVPLMAALDELANGAWVKLDASSRAGLLAKAFGIRSLKPLEPIQPKYSTSYDTVCAFSKRPLNRMNGFALFDDDSRIWKDTRFISAYELRRNHSVAAKNFRLEEGEERRFFAMFNGK